MTVSVSTYLRLMSGIPPSLVVLGQEQLLVQQVHPLLPLDVQGGAHPEGRLVARLRALMSTDFNNAFMSRQNPSDSMYNSSALKGGVRKCNTGCSCRTLNHNESSFCITAMIKCLKCASIIIPQLNRERQQLPAKLVNAGHRAKDLHRICVRDYERLDSLEKSGSRIFRPTRDTQMGTKRSFCNHRTLQWYSPPEIWKTHQFKQIKKKKVSQQTTKICSLVWNNGALTSPLSARSHMKGLEVNSCATKEGERHKQWWLDLHENRIDWL